MQITWLFGNGLDLSFGYKTSYTNFYDYLMDNEDKLDLKDNIIFLKLKDDYKKNEIKDWVDYELKLGKLTSELSDANIATFKGSKLQLDDLLRDFLNTATISEKNDENMNLQNQQIVDMIKKSILNISKLSRAVDTDKVKKQIAPYKQSQFNFKAVSFNYTKTVSNLWKDIPEFKGLKFFEGWPIGGYSVTFLRPFYVHGTLDNDEMIIGVCDESQITNEEYSSDLTVHEMLVKNKMLEIAGQRNYEVFSGIVNSTTIFCLFGVSIGSTDKDYWRLIKKKIITTDSLLIIYAFKEVMPRGITRKNDVLKEIKELFYQSSDATEEEIEKLEDKIIVEINPNIFGSLLRKEE